jgi:DNA (cytosine-5)-methyltransferase 1
MKRALDLFCKAGGATKGLQRAGYHVTGVDIEEQPRYCGDAFVRADATTFDVRGYDFVWASPPCQAFTAYKRRAGHVAPRPNLIPIVRELLQKASAATVIENVEGAPLENPFTLCGSMFGLDVRRHRIFESNFLVEPPHVVTIYKRHVSHRQRTESTCVAQSRSACGVSH